MPTDSLSSTAGRKTRVLLVEDHPVVRNGLAMLIEDDPDLCVCGGTGSVREAMTMSRDLKPEVVIVDMSLEDGNGLELIRELHESSPDLRILALSMHDEAIYAERALRAGARGYVMKKEATETVMLAIRRVLTGDIYVSDRMASRMVHKLVDPQAAASPVESLSAREFEVFGLIAAGAGPSEIARRLALSVKTVETHREHIKEKLGLKNGPQLTRFALRWGMEHH